MLTEVLIARKEFRLYELARMSKRSRLHGWISKEIAVHEVSMGESTFPFSHELVM